MHFVIDREFWRCGDEEGYIHGQGKIALMNRQGFSDCLGQICIQLGLSIFDIRNVQSPDLLPDSKKEQLVPILIKDEDGAMTDLAEAVIDINDSDATQNEQRESLLTALFKEHGHELTFTGKYQDEPAKQGPDGPVERTSPYDIKEGEASGEAAVA